MNTETQRHRVFFLWSHQSLCLCVSVFYFVPSYIRSRGTTTQTGSPLCSDRRSAHEYGPPHSCAPIPADAPTRSFSVASGRLATIGDACQSKKAERPRMELIRISIYPPEDALLSCGRGREDGLGLRGQSDGAASLLVRSI